jgi:hypothetical protein
MFEFLLGRGRTRKPVRRRDANKRFCRMRLEPLEDRCLPANYNWVGMGLWSNLNNWLPVPLQPPGPADTVIFTNANVRNSTMDLGAGGFYHIGQVQLTGYTGTITLQSLLLVDVFSMNDGTITGAKDLYIWQRTNDLRYPAATIFGASSWTGGTISTSSLGLGADNTHPLTLTLGGQGNSPDLETNMTIDADSSVKWQAGNVIVGGGKTVTNFGFFLADSPGRTMGGGAKWNFINQRGAILNQGTGTFKNCPPVNAGGKLFKLRGQAGGDNIFHIIGDYTQDTDTAALTEVDSGTLDIQGNFTVSLGNVTVTARTTLSVSGQYQQSGGTTTLAGLGSLASIANQFTLSGGTLSLGGGKLTATSATIQSGATAQGFGQIAATVTNSGTIQTQGTFTIQGDYTQASSGVLDVEISSDSNDLFAVTGTATFGGELDIVALNGFVPGPGYTATLLNYGTLGGTFSSVVVPTVTGVAHYQYDYPLTGEFTFWVTQT